MLEKEFARVAGKIAEIKRELLQDRRNDLVWSHPDGIGRAILEDVRNAPYAAQVRFVSEAATDAE